LDCAAGLAAGVKIEQLGRDVAYFFGGTLARPVPLIGAEFVQRC